MLNAKMVDELGRVSSKQVMIAIAFNVGTGGVPELIECSAYGKGADVQKILPKLKDGIVRAVAEATLADAMVTEADI